MSAFSPSPFSRCLSELSMSALSPTLELACDLIRRPSVTPVDEGCQDLMMRRLAAAGFRIERMRIEDVENFWAIRGGDGPVLCFAGHTDVVPTGPLQAWQHQPFDALIDERGGHERQPRGHAGGGRAFRRRTPAAQGRDRLPHHQ
jgi:acetylornithine deacetylase/succinyl-diaminopimelate desuccinylase-like protein